MRRSRTAFTSASASAIVGAVLSLTLTVPVASAQQLFQGPASRPPASTESPSTNFDPMASARNPRTMLRNGIDFVKYKDYTRALRFLREAESRQNELDPAERKALAMSIAHATKMIQEGSVRPSPAALANSARRDAAAVQAGAMALAEDLATKDNPVQLTSAQDSKLQLDQADRPARAPEVSERTAGIEVELPRPTVPAPAPLPATPATSAETTTTTPIEPSREMPALLPTPAATQVELPPAARPAPAAEGAPIKPMRSTEPAREVPKAIEVPSPSEPEARPVISLEPLPDSAPTQNSAPAQAPATAKPPVAPAPLPEPGQEPIQNTPPVALPEPAPVPLPIPSAPPAREPEPMPLPAAPPSEASPAPIQAPAPAPAPTTPSAPTEPIQLAPTPAPAPTSAPTEPIQLAPTPAEPPAFTQSPAPAPLPQPEERPMAVAPINLPRDGSAPAATPGEPTPPAAPAVEPAPAPEAESLPAANPVPAAPLTTTEEAPRQDALQAAPAPESAQIRADGPANSASSVPIPPEVQEDIARIARRQAMDGRGPGAGRPGKPDDDVSSIIIDTQSRFEVSRPPSSTEARPLRRIPVPEEFVPLGKREWEPIKKYWAASATCHMPLYFQDANLERYGNSVETYFGRGGRFLTYPIDDPKQSKQRNQILQPFFSAGLFAFQVIALPYNIAVDPPWEAEYDLGYYRPGDRMPRGTYYLPTTGVGPPLHGRRY